MFISLPFLSQETLFYNSDSFHLAYRIKLAFKLTNMEKTWEKKEFICLQIKMFMSPSHAMIYVSLLRGALITSHAFTFNIGNRQGRTVSRVQFDTK